MYLELNLLTKNWAELSLFIFTILTVVLGFSYVTNPGLRDLVSPYQCLFYQTMGLLCPACGGTRAIIHLLSGNILSAIRSNGLAVLMLPGIVYGMITSFRLAFDQRFTAADINIAPIWLWSIPVTVIIFWVIRNIPAFTFLRP